MKKTSKNAIISLLCVIICASFFSCAQNKPAMSLEETEIPGSVYAYYLACYKQYWLTYLSQSDTKEFWDAVSDGKRNADILTEISEDAIKKRVAANHLFEKYELLLTEEEYMSIERLVTGINAASEDGKGISGDEVFKTLDMNEDDLKTVLIIDSKVGALQEYLYGADGTEKITDDKKEAYYKDNYIRIKLLYLINGDYVRDEDGNIEYDEYGNAKVKEISDERYEEKYDLAKDILDKVRAGDDLDKYIDEYSEHLKKDDYKNGHYLSSSNGYDEVVYGASTKLGIGEAAMYPTSYGIYVIQRAELDPGAWKNRDNEAGGDFFNFEALVLEKEFDDYIKPWCDQVKVDREVTGKYKMEDLPYTFSWQYIF